jgi:hypothetical protein
MQKLHTTPHPVEVLLLVVVLALEAAWLLARAAQVPLVAVLLTVAGWRPATAPPPPPPPLEHPLAVVAAGLAEGLAAVPVRQLRQLARAAGLPRQLSRSGRRADLLAALVALEVAACS